jgi:hypothetical protein
MMRVELPGFIEMNTRTSTQSRGYAYETQRGLKCVLEFIAIRGQPTMAAARKAGKRESSQTSISIRGK